MSHKGILVVYKDVLVAQTVSDELKNTVLVVGIVLLDYRVVWLYIEWS